MLARKVGAVRTEGRADGLTKAQAERVLRRMREIEAGVGTGRRARHDGDRLAISSSIPKQVWREALPGRFDQLSMTIELVALETIIEFGAERPYATMAAAQGAALASRRIGLGAERATVGAFEADQGIEFARKRLADDV